ncbi:hypothetical protein JI747_009625 [Chryseobacterium sp. RG1]|uniref:Uncharacterized protein n=2 Tax=Chryseobacterium tagetis TaxID=2801334 RepID=A0ABS8A0W6_9FLAO|nr:hypothetical protein [Chryseobacterium tagetis]
MVNWNVINGNGGKFSSKEIRKNMLNHHQGNLVDSIEKKYNEYKVSLMNGLSLIFDADGKYRRTSM